LDAAERQRTTGNSSEAVGRLTFGEAVTTYREQLQEAAIRPNTKAFREAGLKLVLRSWKNVEALNVRRITSKMVEEWLRRFKSTAQPYVPRGAKTPAINSTGASMTTIKCALDAVRQGLDVAVSGGHLYANPPSASQTGRADLPHPAFTMVSICSVVRKKSDRTTYLVHHRVNLPCPFRISLYTNQRH
jgi:hypothetical protein